MLEKEFNYYVNHQNELVEKYKGKYLVIQQEKVIGVYDTMRNAYFDSVKKYELGTFMIHECQPGKENYTQILPGRAILF